MNAEKLREARRRRILENSENRLQKITTLSSNENVPNGQAIFVKDKSTNNLNVFENNTHNFELPDSTVQNPSIQNVTFTNIEERTDFNLGPNPLSPNVYSKSIKYKIEFSLITILHISLSQIVLLLLYYDFGFLFGNSVLVPFFLCTIPELYVSNEQHDSVHMIVLLMLGFPQNLAKRISRCCKLAIMLVRRFCIYIFCFTCSYTILTNLYPDVRHNISVNNIS